LASRSSSGLEISDRLSLGVAVTTGHRPSSAACPPSAESAPLSQPLYCMSTRPTSPPYPVPQLPSSSPPPLPVPLACDLRLASADVSAARRDSASSHPGRAHFSPPRRTCVCARHTAAPQRSRMWNICTLAAASSLSLSPTRNRILGPGWIQGVCADILSHTWPIRGDDQPRTTPMPIQRISTDF
jgi:hypothetical protein